MQQVPCVEKQMEKNITKVAPRAVQMTSLQQYRHLLHSATSDGLVILFVFFLVHKKQILVKSF